MKITERTTVRDYMEEVILQGEFSSERNRRILGDTTLAQLGHFLEDCGDEGVEKVADTDRRRALELAVGSHRTRAKARRAFNRFGLEEDGRPAWFPDNGSAAISESEVGGFSPEVVDEAALEIFGTGAYRDTDGPKSSPRPPAVEKRNREITDANLADAITQLFT